MLMHSDLDVVCSMPPVIVVTAIYLQVGFIIHCLRYLSIYDICMYNKSLQHGALSIPIIKQQPQPIL